MAIKQTIKYNSDSDYFAGFLQALVKDSEIIGSVNKDESEIVLVLDHSDLEALDRFSQNTKKYMPYSIFLGDIDTQNEDIDVVPSSYRSQSYKIALCPKCLEKLTDPASSNYLDDSMECTHYSNELGESIVDSQNYSAHYSEQDTLLVVDSSILNKLFFLTQNEINTLLSIEKPTIKVTIKDEDLKSFTGKKFINIKSAHTMKSTLSALNSKESGLEYLFFKELDTIRVSITKDDLLIIKDTLDISKKLEKFHEDRVLNRFLNIANEAKISRALGVSLSAESGIKFLVTDKNESKVAFGFGEFELAKVLDELTTKKQKLLKNFENKYPNTIKNLQENLQYDMHETVSCLLGLDAKGFNALSDKSLEFHGNGGLRIDTFYKEDGFDYISFLGSIMSFKLAGSDEHYLAYSIFEALADMAISTLNQLKETHKISNFIMMGNMFENSVLHSRIKDKFSLSNPYFSKGFALDD